MIATTPVKSSNVRAVGYDPATSTLRVEFTSGGVFDYSNVPQSVATELMDADSVGRYFAANVRGKFGHAPVPVEPEQTA